jgi:hypothetical protein
MVDRNRARAEAQERVLPLAANWGEGWEFDDVEFVAGTTELPVEEVALALHRSVYAVAGVRQALRDGRRIGCSQSRQRARHMAALKLQAWAPDDPRWD